MRYITHYFARSETLDRACRWLNQVGFDESCIDSHHDGIPRLSVRVSSLQAAQVSLIIRAAEATDPDGWPGIWELARMKPSQSGTKIEAHPASTFGSHGPHSFAMEWHPQDSSDTAAFDATDSAQLRAAYVDRRV